MVEGGEMVRLQERQMLSLPHPCGHSVALVLETYSERQLGRNGYTGTFLVLRLLSWDGRVGLVINPWLLRRPSGTFLRCCSCCKIMVAQDHSRSRISIVGACFLLSGLILIRVGSDRGESALHNPTQK